MMMSRSRAVGLRRALQLALAAALSSVCPVSAAAQPPQQDSVALAQLTGVELARALAELTFRSRNQDAQLALDYGKRALDVLERSPEPTIRVDVLAEMAWAAMVLGDYDEATRLATQAREEARAASYDAGEARAINNLGVVARRRGDSSAAVALFVESLEIRERLGDQAEVAMAHNNLGFVYSTDLGDFARSLEHHLEALQIRETLDRPADLALSLNNIGVLYQSMGELDRAREHLERALELRRQHEIPLRVASTLSNLGEVLLEQGDAGAALEHFHTALSIREEAGERTSVAASRLNIGQALTVLGRHDEAETSMRIALEEAQALGETRSQVRAHQRLGQLEATRGQYRRAEQQFNRAAALAHEMGARHLISELYGMLADVRELAGDFTGALAAHRAFKSTSDTVLGENQAQRIAMLDARYQAERREREIATLRHEQALHELQVQRQRRQRDLVAGVALALVLCGFVIHRRHVAFQREVHRRLEIVARTDPLTGLANRRAFMEMAEAERTRMLRSGAPASVVIADVDHFKAFNDVYGHGAGDRVLQHVAGLLEGAVREQDVVARWGGEEFVLLLPETPAEGASRLAEKLRAIMAEAPLTVGDTPTTLTMTFGVGEARPETSVDDWIHAADQALYDGKASGRDRVVTTGAG